MTQLVDIVVAGESFEGTRSQLSRWLKPVGAQVQAGEPLIEVETDKVTVEVPAPTDGVLVEVLKQEQDELAIGDVLGRIGTDASAIAAAAAAVAASVVAPSVVAPAVVGAAVPPAEPVLSSTPPSVSSAPPAPSAASTPRTAAASLSPAVRRLLVQHDLAAEAVNGTGADGRVTVDDVLRHVAALAAAPSAGGTAGAIEDGVRRVPHSTTRRRIAEHMVESLLRTAPHVTTVFEVDLGAVLAHRAGHRAEFERRGTPLTLTAYFVAACVAAIRAVPEANARWTDDALELVERIDIGIGTAVEGKGLVVPVIRDVASLDLAGIAARLADLSNRARTHALTAADLKGGTFTISNHGVSGSLLAAPIIINQPQSAILGVGKLEKRAVVLERDGADVVAVRPRCYVTLTLDHRVMDGHQANRFLSTWVAQIEGWKG